MVRLWYEAFNATKQVNTHLLKPDVVLIEPDDVLGQGVSHGREAYVRSARKMTETWDDFRYQPEEFFDLGDDRVMVFVRLCGRARYSGIPLDLRPAHLFTFRAGQLARLHVYAERNDALEAVELRE